MYMLAPLGMTLVPLLVGAAASDFGFSASQVGFLATADLAGIAVASITAPFWMHRFTWVQIGLASIVIVVSGNIASLFISNYPVLCLVRFVTELGSGGLFSLALVTLGTLPNPDRYFSMGIGLTIGLSVGIFLWLPEIISQNGISALFILHGVVAFAILPSLYWLRDERTSQETRASATRSSRSYIGLFICFAGFSFFTLAEGGVWSYIERVGTSFGLTAEYVGDVLAVTQAVSFVAAIASTGVSTRIGRTLPIALGILAFLVGLIMLLWAQDQYFLIAASLTQFGYIFVMPYLLLLSIEMDPSRRFYVLTTAFKMGGFAAGPAIIAFFLAGQSGATNYDIVSWVGIGFLVASFLIIVPMAWMLDRQAKARTF